MVRLLACLLLASVFCEGIAHAQVCRHDLESPATDGPRSFGLHVSIDEDVLAVTEWRSSIGVRVQFFTRSEPGAPWDWEGFATPPTVSWTGRARVRDGTVAFATRNGVLVYRRLGGLWIQTDHVAPAQAPHVSSELVAVDGDTLVTLSSGTGPQQVLVFRRNPANEEWDQVDAILTAPPCGHPHVRAIEITGDRVFLGWEERCGTVRVDELDLSSRTTTPVADVSVVEVSTSNPSTSIAVLSQHRIAVASSRSVVVLGRTPGGSWVEEARPEVAENGHSPSFESVLTIAGEGERWAVAVQYDMGYGAPRRHLVRLYGHDATTSTWGLEGGWGVTGDEDIGQPGLDLSATDLALGFPGLEGERGLVRQIDLGCELLGEEYCRPSTPNSVGSIARSDLIGSPSVSENRLSLAGTGLPPSSIAYGLASTSRGSLHFPPGSQGRLCLGGAIGRFHRAGEVQVVDTSGRAEITIDLMDVPSPAGGVAIQTGETWHFQLWYRDANPEPTSNMTTAVRLPFRP